MLYGPVGRLGTRKFEKCVTRQDVESNLMDREAVGAACEAHELRERRASGGGRVRTQDPWQGVV